MIREAAEADFLNLTALSIQVWLNTYAKDGIRDAISGFVLNEFTPDYFRRIHASANRRILVAIREGHLVGFVSIDLSARCGIHDFDGYEITTLYVQEHFQNEGIGSGLLARIRRDHGERLWLTTWIHNTPAIGFYKRHGFRRIGSAWFDLEGEKHENLVLAT